MNDYTTDRALVLNRADGSDYEPHCATYIDYLFVPDGDRETFFASREWVAIAPMLHARSGKIFFYDKGTPQWPSNEIR